jgi:hypothetical protein
MSVRACGGGRACEEGLERGGDGSSSEVEPARRSRELSSEAEPARGRCRPSREALAGPLRWAAGAATVWAVPWVRA